MPTDVHQLDSDGFECRPVRPEVQKDALAVLLTGSVSHPGTRVTEFLRVATIQNIDLNNLWACYKNNVPVAATLIIPSAGRTAMGFISPINDDRIVEPASRLVRLACGRQDSASVQLVQMLLEPGQNLEKQALTESGFSHLAELVYMRRRTDPASNPSPIGAHLRLLPWEDSRKQFFADSILRSYQGTLDCPGLLGVRHIDDIIAGHMAAGQFVPELWNVVLDDDEPIGVMLINLVPSSTLSELVYFGLAPSARGRGIASRLIRYGLQSARKHRATEMVLAVDSQNTPAIRLYQRIAFIPETRKNAMIMSLT